jgi:hypothetical protein
LPTGGQLETLLEALSARERQRATLEAERTAVLSGNRLQAKDANRVRDELLTIANDWRQVLANNPTNARPIVSSLLKGPVTITPTVRPKEWTLRGEGTLTGLFERTIYLSVARPQRGSWLCVGCNIRWRDEPCGLDLVGREEVSASTTPTASI